MGWLLSAADRDRFGGPYSILSRFEHNLEKGRHPSAGLVQLEHTTIWALRTVMRIVIRTLNSI